MPRAEKDRCTYEHRVRVVDPFDGEEDQIFITRPCILVLHLQHDEEGKPIHQDVAGGTWS